MNRVRLCLLFLGVVTGISNSVIAADDTGVKNRVNFQVESGRDVRNDLMVVVMKVLVEDREPEQVAEQINRTMSWAMGQVKPEQAVKAESGNYRTWPVDEDKSLCVGGGSRNCGWSPVIPRGLVRYWPFCSLDCRFSPCNSRFLNRTGNRWLMN